MSITINANARRDAIDVRASDISTEAFFRQALCSLADRLGATRFLVTTDTAGNEMRVSAAQLYAWAQVGPHAIEERELPFAIPGNFALMCDDIASQHDAWRSLRRGDLRINQAQFERGYVNPPRDAGGHIPPNTSIEIDVAPAAANSVAVRPVRHAEPAMTEADAITRVTNNPSAYHSLPAALRLLPSVVLATMSQPHGGDYLGEVPVALRSDDAVRAAVAHSDQGRALAWASPTQLASVPFVRSLFVGTTDHIDLSFAAPNVRADAGVRTLAFERLIPAAARGSFSTAQREAYLAVMLDMAPADTPAARDPIVAGALLAYGRDGDFDAALAGECLVNVETWIQTARVRGSVAHNTINEIAALPAADRAALASRVRHAHVAMWERFESLADLRRTLDDIEHRSDHDRPVLLMVVSRDDHNRAMEADVREARRQFPNYRIVYREASSRDEVLREISAQSSQPAEVVLVSGHGDRTSMTMGPPGWRHRDFDRHVLDDQAALRAARAGVARGARIYSLGCSNGEGRNHDGNVVNTWAAAFPHAQASGGALSVTTFERRPDDQVLMNVRNPRVPAYTVPPLEAGVSVLPLR